MQIHFWIKEKKNKMRKELWLCLFFLVLSMIVHVLGFIVVSWILLGVCFTFWVKVILFNEKE
jgi:diacylglycerol kinase